VAVAVATADERPCWPTAPPRRRRGAGLEYGEDWTAKAELRLTAEEREMLVCWARRAKSSQALAQRCKIVLACADGTPNKQVAADLGVHPATVGTLRLIGVRL
jgi:DNA-binding CsgD family transcriptional regulator